MASKAPSAAPLPKIPAKSGGASPAAVGVIALAVGLVAGYGVGRATLGASPNPLAPSKGGYQDGYDAAHKKLLASGLLPQVQTETRTLSGTVTSISADSLVIATDFKSPDPLSEVEIPKQRTVTIGKDTKIQLITPKDQATYLKELQDYQKAVAKDQNAPPPQTSTVKDIALSDLKQGDSVTVTADKDVLSAASFTAVSIAKYPPATPGAVPPGALVPPPAPVAPPPPPQQQ